MTYEELQQRRERIDRALVEGADDYQCARVVRALLDDAAKPLLANRDNTFAQGEYSRALSICERELGL